MKKTLSFFVLLLLFQHNGHAQKIDKALADSLLAELNHAKGDTTRVNLYAALMYAHVYYKPEKGLTYQQAALELAQKINWKPGIAKVKDNAGRLYWRLGNFTEALKLHFEALELYTQAGNKHRQAFVMVEIGQDYLDGSNYADAKTYLLKAIKLAEETNDRQVIKFGYDILLYLYNTQGDLNGVNNAMYAYIKIAEKIGDKNAIAGAAQILAFNAGNIGNMEEALKYYKIGLKAAIETGDELLQAYCYRGMGTFFSWQRNFTEAAHSYANALKIASELNDVQLLADVHLAMGNFNLDQNKHTDALNHYLSAAAKYKSIANQLDLASVYAKMGIVYTHLKKYGEAKIFFNKAMVLNEGLKTKPSMADYYDGITILDSVTGNWKDAFDHYKKYIAIRDSSFNKESLKKMVASQMQYQADKKEAVAKAVQEKKDLETQGEIRRQRNILIAAFTVIALVLLFSVVVYKQRNKIAKEKKRSDQLLVDKEMLIREVHHRVKNNLEVVSSLLALQSAQIDDPNTKEAMQEGQNRVHSIGIVHQKLYQGTNLGAIEMKDYFINLSDSILDSFGAEGRVTVACVMEKLDVDIDTAVPLGLIVNELLTNTLKYAYPDGQKGHATIKLERTTSGLLQLEVSDDGVGKSGTTKGTGFGGQLVALLTQQLDGSMREVVGKGTRVFFEFREGGKRVG